MNGPVWAEYLP